MGQIIGIVSAVLLLSAIYLKIDGKKNASKYLFITGIIGMILFVVIALLAIFD